MDSQKYFSPIYNDFLKIYNKDNSNLILGQYSITLYNQMILDNKLDFFLDDVINIDYTCKDSHMNDINYFEIPLLGKMHYE